MEQLPFYQAEETARNLSSWQSSASASPKEAGVKDCSALPCERESNMLGNQTREDRW